MQEPMQPQMMSLWTNPSSSPLIDRHDACWDFILPRARPHGRSLWHRHLNLSCHTLRESALLGPRQAATCGSSRPVWKSAPA